MIVCSGGFLINKNKFLFGKRSKNKSWAPKAWDIVGGKSLKKEKPYDTLKREVYEEIGVIVLHANLLTTLEIWDDNDQNYFKYHIYMITSWKGKATNCSNEHSKIRWLTRDKLATKKIALKEYLSLIDGWLDGNVPANAS